ncbi:MAG: formylglycine-generating enzyme family protein [Acidobacteriota bacterium]
MRFFITSTPDELLSLRTVAADVVRELGHEPALRDPIPRRGLNPVASCERQVALSDALLAIVGWCCGPVPPVALGGDGLLPWTCWEVTSAFAHDLPVMAFLTGRHFAPELREEVPEARALVKDFRGELARLATDFDDKAEFRRLVRERVQATERDTQSSLTLPVGCKLRKFLPPELPSRPYPLLLPYTHPDLMAGRDDDLADLRRKLSLPLTVLGLHAASGTGKSSLLAGGLVPRLRAAGQPVAFVRHPTEPGLAERLLTDLIESEEGRPPDTCTDPRRFINRLVSVGHEANGTPPLLVIDQFEDLLKDGVDSPRAVAGRTELGPLLAASAQRLPGSAGSPCRWLLAYRQEYHGRLLEWLEDVLSDARKAGLETIEALPHDLSRPSRFLAWALRPLATPMPGSGDPTSSSAQVFLEAIAKPLRTGGKRFPWAFARGHAERLAHAFAEARIRRPDAPLVPELQVVLAHLLDQSGEPSGGQAGSSVVVTVPEEPDELIDRALEDHLRRALDLAFPQPAAGNAATRMARSRALLVLRELAEGHAKREGGRMAEALSRALGPEERDALEKLSTARTRLVVLKRLRHGGPDPWAYALAHDRLAEVLVRVVDQGEWAGLGVDSQILGLRRFVALQSRLHASGDSRQSTEVPPRHFATIEANQEVLFWRRPHREWWEACRARQRRERRRKIVQRGMAIVLLLLVVLGTWTVADQRARHRALLAEVAEGEPEVAFAALDQLTQRDHDTEKILSRLRQRDRPFDVFSRGLGGVGEARRADAVLRVAELVLPILRSNPQDPVLIASLVWALDLFAGREPAQRHKALLLRNETLRQLRQARPPPPQPEPGDPDWAEIPAGTFSMGTAPEDVASQPRMKLESPSHRVTLSPFRMLTHEVTNAEYRQLWPDYPGAEDLPATEMNWYEAYTYAAWLGGRLPTEAEWEYAARAGCAYTYCRHDGTEATLDDVAWWLGNAGDSETGEPQLQSIKQLETNPWGLFDIYGNAWELTASWMGPYTQAAKTDPSGPTDNARDRRILRGGSGWRSAIYPSRRSLGSSDSRIWAVGFRVVQPEAMIRVADRGALLAEGQAPSEAPNESR